MSSRGKKPLSTSLFYFNKQTNKKTKIQKKYFQNPTSVFSKRELTQIHILTRDAFVKNKHAGFHF